MSILRALSMMFLLLAIAVVVYLALGTQALPFVATFSIQAAAIVLLWIQLRRVRRQKGITWIQSMAVPLKVAIPMLAAAGIVLTLLKVGFILSGNAPSGAAISSVKWNRSENVCRVTYNTSERAERPLDVCTDLDRSIGLAFGGGWILVSAIGVWLAFLKPSAKL